MLWTIPITFWIDWMFRSLYCDVPSGTGTISDLLTSVGDWAISYVMLPPFWGEGHNISTVPLEPTSILIM